MKIIVVFLIAGISLTACNNPPANSPVTTGAGVDSLVGNWCNNWNNHDSAAVRNMFDSNAVLIDDNLVARNRDELSAKWISPNIKWTHKLKADKLQGWQDAARAGYTGYYELDVVINNIITAHRKGVFSINWQQNATGEWKIISAHIHSFTDRQ